MKPGILSRLKPLRTAPRPITPEEALYEWYYRGVDADARLSTKARLLLQWLCIRASSFEDLAPLPYTLQELRRKLTWPPEQLREAAECAAACGYVRLDEDTITLTDPRARPSANRENSPRAV